MFLSCLALLAPHIVGAQPDMGFATRLPAGTSFYVTTENLGEVASAIAASNFYRGVYAIPSVAEAVEQGKFPDLKAKWDSLVVGEQGPMVRAAASLLDRELVFASTGDGSRGIVPGVIQFARVALLAQEYKMGGMDRQVGDHLREVAEGLSPRFGLEPFALAFRTDQRAMLEPMVAGLLTQLPPAIAPMVSAEEIDGVPFTTLTVVPALFFPPENLRASLVQVVSDSIALDSVISAYRALTLKVRLAWMDEYLVVVAEDQAGSFAGQLARGPEGASLADLDEFTALLARSHNHPARRVVLDLRGWRASLAGQLAEVAGDLQMCRTLMGFAAGLGLNAEIVGQKLQEFAATSLDPELSVVSADLERGVRVVGDLYHAPDSRACVMGAKDIALASRVPASALAWSVWGGPNAAEAWRTGLDEAVKWRSMPWATMSMPPEQRAVQGKLTDLMTITRDSLPSALGQEGMCVLSWDGSLNAIKDQPVNLAVPEIAFMLEITDRERIRSLGSVYAAKIAELLSQKADTAVAFPAPMSEKVKNGEKIWWEGLIPVQGTGIVPTVYLTDRYLIASSSARLADEVYDLSRGKGKSHTWPEGELKQLLGGASSGAGVMLLAEMAPRLMPIIEYAMGASKPELTEKDLRTKEDIAAALKLLQAIPQIWAHVTMDGSLARMTGELVVQDLP
jgi:hypothetical protein